MHAEFKLHLMIHYHNSLDPDEDFDPFRVKAFEERFGQILDIADREYEYEPPSKYYMDGVNLKALKVLNTSARV